MTKARNLADLLDSNGDVKTSGLDNVPPSNDASALTTGTLSVDRIADGAIGNAKIASGVDASKLTTGTIPAARIANGSIAAGKLDTVYQTPLTAGTHYQTPLTAGTDYLTPTGDGSGLSGITAYTKADTNPSTNTNGSAGDIWVNHSSGKIYICTDATTNANVWRNVKDSADAVYPNTIPTNPTNTASFPASKNDGDTFEFTFSGATDPNSGYGDSVVAYLVDNFSSANLTVTTAEVSAGSAHSFTVGTPASTESFTFRVRAKDNYGAYSTGITVSVTLVPKLYVTATGGTVTTSGDYKIHTFTSSGTFAVSESGNTAGNNQVQYLVVAGGGGGACCNAGGGGGGGQSYGTDTLSASGNYAVTVGGGGSGAQFGNRGGNSTFNGHQGNGGGGGGSTYGTGGCGGGGGCDHGTSGNAGNQGYGGGSGACICCQNPGGGGGGMGSGGANGVSGKAGNGGSGRYDSINGGTYSGGGGGGAHQATRGYGGSGGGGNGKSTNSGAGSHGGTNTGGGGGSGDYFNGGSGIVVLKYKFQN
jgi:hypothetical protein